MEGRRQPVMVWGLGPIPWASLRVHPRRHWRTGFIDDFVGLSPSQLIFTSSRTFSQPGENLVSLAGLLDASLVSRLSALPDVGQVKVEEVNVGPSSSPPRFPGLSHVAMQFAAWATTQFGQPGTIFVPAVWSRSSLYSQLTDPWSNLGWQVSALEDVLRWVGGASVEDGFNRVVTTDGLFCRIDEPDRRVVLPANYAAAVSVEVGQQTLAAIADLVDEPARRAWTSLHQDHGDSGFDRVLLQQVHLHLYWALLEGRTEVVLGGLDAPVFSTFLFASEETAEHMARLHQLRFRVFLPHLEDFDWMGSLESSGFVDAGARFQPNASNRIPWGQLTNVVVANNSEEACRYLEPREDAKVRFVGVAAFWEEDAHPVEPVEAVESQPPPPLPVLESPPLEEIEVEAPPPLPPPLPDSPTFLNEPDTESVPPADSPGPPPSPPEAHVEDPPAQDIETILGEPDPDFVSSWEDFDPHRIEVYRQHRSESVRIFVDGALLDPKQPEPSEFIQGFAYRTERKVSHGALVRVDFEPTS